MKYAATAALALACAATTHAQTQVKIYGVMDAGIVAEHGGPAGSRTVLAPGDVHRRRHVVGGDVDAGHAHRARRPGRDRAALSWCSGEAACRGPAPSLEASAATAAPG